MKKPTHSPLQDQLELERLKRAVQYVEQSAHTQKHLTASELLHLNEMLTGSTDSWRLGEAQIKIPGGVVHHFQLISNPIARSRALLSEAFDQAENVDPKLAAVELYLKLIEEHLFEDANRRTSALALLWVLLCFSLEVDVIKLLELPVGNLREHGHKMKIRNELLKMIDRGV